MASPKSSAGDKHTAAYCTNYDYWLAQCYTGMIMGKSVNFSSVSKIHYV